MTATALKVQRINDIANRVGIYATMSTVDRVLLMNAIRAGAC